MRQADVFAGVADAQIAFVSLGLQCQRQPLCSSTRQANRAGGALLHERAVAGTTLGAGDVAQMQFPASGLRSAPGRSETGGRREEMSREF